MNKREKSLNETRLSRDSAVAHLASLRERVPDPAVKGRLRRMEDSLAVCPPTTDTGAIDVDNELKTLAAAFLSVSESPALVERDLARMEKLVARRGGFM